MWFPRRANQCQDGGLTYQCIATQVHVIPLQVMIGQIMGSYGECIYCGRMFAAVTIRAEHGQTPTWGKLVSSSQDRRGLCRPRRASMRFP